MRDHRFDHMRPRGPNPDANAKSFETMFGAEAKLDINPPRTLYPGQQQIR
jgi:lactoylglutathione lyase